jgi:6-phosphogluconolactonase
MTDKIVLPDADALATEIARRLAEIVTAAHAQRREPHVVLTGGTIAIAAYEQLTDDADWTRVHWWWGDERFVPAGHADRNDRQAREAFLDRFGVPDDHVHPMPAQDADSASIEHADSASIGLAADRYGATLPAEPFDLLLLGVGPDGHVASLFPGFAQLDETERRCVEVHDSPKPPPERISLTFPVLNNAREVWFLVSGEGKADAVARAWGDGTVQDTPATGVHGLGEPLWLLDAPAASHL